MRLLAIDLPQKFYTIGWIGWAIYFIILETLAILDEGVGESLSAHVVWLRQNIGSLMVFLIIALSLWFIYHFVFEKGVFT